MSQSGKYVSGGPSPGSAIETLTGNTGGAVPPTAGNIDFITANSTVIIAGNPATSTLTMDFAGDAANNVVLGSSLASLTSGDDNVGLGYESLFAITSGYQNVAIGQANGEAITTGYNNTLVGYEAADSLVTGHDNIVIGKSAGTAYTSNETGNIIIGSVGIIHDSDVTRIGAIQTSCFIAGIDGVNLASANVVTEVANQLGTAAITAGTGISISTATPNEIIITNSAPSPASVVETITGDTGGALSPSAGNINIIANGGAGSSVLFSGSAPTLTFKVTDSNYSTAIGYGAATTGADNVLLGYGAVCGSSTSNVIIGYQAGTGGMTGNPGYNVGIGEEALPTLTSGTGNIGIGFLSANNLTTGSSNIAIGAKTIITAATSNQLRIGRATGTADTGDLSTAFICGIQGVNVGSVATVVSISGDQLGQTTITAGTGITVTPGANSITIAATSAGDIQTITGNDGTPESPVAGNFNFLTANTTLKFKGTAATETLDFSLSNLVLGSSLPSLAGGLANTGLGQGVLNAITSGNTNTAIGTNALLVNATGNSNTACGEYSLRALLSGSNNSALGYSAGVGYTGAESSNVTINHAGILGESNVLRIGSATGTGVANLAAAYICGIQGVNVGSVATVVSINGDQLGQTTITAGTNVAITTGPNSITISANATSYTENYTGIAFVNSPYSATANDYYIGADVTGGAITIYLPAAPATGRALVVKDKAGLAATSNITVTTLAGIVNIDGATTFVMNTNYEAAQFIWNGTYWEIY